MLSNERMAAVVCEPVKLHSDARGIVFEPVTPEEIAAQQNIHFVLTQPGGVRGNHYHQRGTEIAIVLGPALVRVREQGVIRDFQVPPGQAWRFTLPPGVPHAIKNTDVQPNAMLGFNTERHDPGKPDVVREVLIES